MSCNAPEGVGLPCGECWRLGYSLGCQVSAVPQHACKGVADIPVRLLERPLWQEKGRCACWVLSMSAQQPEICAWLILRKVREPSQEGKGPPNSTSAVDLQCAD